VSFDFEQISLADVSHHFGRRRALSHISFDGAAGEIIGLLGPNGAGKSTLLSIVATLVTPAAGQVRYGGQPAREAGPGLRARVGLVGHDVYLYPELSASENLAFFARLYGLSDRRSRVAEALERAGLASRAADLVSSFSRGMRQRLALERALLHRPRLLLLDEPFTGLDRAAAAALVSRLTGLRANRCITILATHDVGPVRDLLDRTIVLDDGRLVAAQPGH
jgi:heme exporter protein A